MRLRWDDEGHKYRSGSIRADRLRAVRRYWGMVFVLALLTAAAAVGYTLVVPEVYRAYATVTVPPTSLSQEEDSDQYLDSQVLLIQSQEVADRAARIANAALNENVLSPATSPVSASPWRSRPRRGPQPVATAPASSPCRLPGPMPRSLKSAPTLCSRPSTTCESPLSPPKARRPCRHREGHQDARTQGQLKDLREPTHGDVGQPAGRSGAPTDRHVGRRTSGADQCQLEEIRRHRPGYRD